MKSFWFVYIKYLETGRRNGRWIIPDVTRRLVLAAGASWREAWLRVGSHLLHVGLLLHHLSEVDIATDGVLVTVLTGVDAGSIGGVALEGLEGVEVVGGTGGIGVPSGVDILLGSVVPELVVVLSVLEVEVGGETSAGKGGGEGRGTGGQGKDGGRVLELRIEQNG